MKMETFKGKNSLEIGKAFGKVYKKNGFAIDWVNIDQDIYMRQLEIYKKHFPSFLEELRGIAAAGGYDQDKLNYAFIGNSVQWLKSKPRYMRTACSIFGLKKDKDLF